MPPARSHRASGGPAPRAALFMLALIVAALAAVGCGGADGALSDLRDRGDAAADSLGQRAEVLIERVRRGEIPPEAAVARIAERAKALSGRARSVAREEIERLRDEAADLDSDARLLIEAARRDVAPLAGDPGAARAGVENEADDIERAIRARAEELRGEVDEGRLEPAQAARTLADDVRAVSADAARVARDDLERVPEAAGAARDRLSARVARARDALEQLIP